MCEEVFVKELIPC